MLPTTHQHLPGCIHVTLCVAADKLAAAEASAGGPLSPSSPGPRRNAGLEEMRNRMMALQGNLQSLQRPASAMMSSSNSSSITNLPVAAEKPMVAAAPAPAAAAPVAAAPNLTDLKERMRLLQLKQEQAPTGTA